MYSAAPGGTSRDQRIRWVAYLLGGAVYSYLGYLVLDRIADRLVFVAVIGPFFTGLVLIPIAYIAGRYRLNAFLTALLIALYMWAALSAGCYCLAPYETSQPWWLTPAWVPVFYIINAPILLPSYLIGRRRSAPL